MTPTPQETWRQVPPVARSEAARLARSRRALGEFLVEQFDQTFHRHVDEVLFETFPDGLYATLYVEGVAVASHNVWAVDMASALSDAGVEVHVVVRSSSDRIDR